MTNTFLRIGFDSEDLCRFLEGLVGAHTTQRTPFSMAATNIGVVVLVCCCKGVRVGC